MANNYDGLREYLEKRYADAVVLTFDQVEALLGFPLAPAARADRAWWSDVESDAWPQAQSRAWTAARRTATPNLGAGTVRFERIPD